jgi:hypothetical protein
MCYLVSPCVFFYALCGKKIFNRSEKICFYRDFFPDFAIGTPKMVF